MKKLFLLSLALMATFSLWAAGTALTDLNFSYPSTLPSAYTYSATNTPTIATVGSKNSVYVCNGGGTTIPTFSSDNSSAPTGGKRWMAFCPAVDCSVTISVYSNQKIFYIWDKDHNTTSNYVSTYTNSAQAWESSWVVNLTANTWYVIGGANSQSYVGAMQFKADCDATIPGDISKGTLTANTLTLNAAGAPASNNVWYWQTSSTGTDKTNSGTSFVVTAAGTYYIRSLYNNDCWSGAKSIVVNAVDLVENYTVVYKDGETPLGSETVEVGQKPTASEITTAKDFYTFAAWQLSGVDKALTDDSWKSVTNGSIVTLTARYERLYAYGIYEFTGHLTMGTAPNQMTIESNTSGKDYSAGRIDNIYVSAQKIGYEASGDYAGWKLKTQNGTLRFMVENACGVRITLGESNPLHIEYTEGGVAKNANIAKSTTSDFYQVDANSLVTLKNTTNNQTVTLKKIEILSLYNATYSSAKGTAPEAETNVSEVTLAQITGVAGWLHTGWKADVAVTVDAATVTANTLIANGKTAVLSANTTFTAQWEEDVCPSGMSISGENSYSERTDIELTASLTAGSGEIIYTWYKGEDLAAAKEAGSIGTGTTYSKASCKKSDAGNYFCVATKANCSDAASEAFEITITDYVCPASGLLFEWKSKTGISDANIDAGTYTFTEETPGSWLKSVYGGQAIMSVPSNENMRIRGSQLAYNSNNSYIKVEMECELKSGDTILVNSSGNTNDLWISLEASRPSNAESAIAVIKQGTAYIVSVNKDDDSKDLVGESDFYFWRSSSTTQIGNVRIARPEGSATGIENQESKIDNRKFIKDGQLFIEKNGHVYNVFGACIK